jgi:hypothetical protein
VEEMAAARWANERDADVVCIDCPWGRERESGESVLPFAVLARLSHFFLSSFLLAPLPLLLRLEPNELNPLSLSTGAPLTPTILQPTYLLSLGALRHISVSLASQTSSPRPELVVLDVGIPPHLWARCGVSGFEGNGGRVWEEGWWTGVVWR